MGAIPSKVGTSKDEKMGYDVPLRAQSTHDLTQILRSNGLRKLYRKNSGHGQVWYGSQGALHHHQQDMQQECRRCDALCQLAVDKDMIIGSLEAVVAEMRIKLAAYEGQVRELRSRTQGKRQAMALKLFEAREQICFLEELCSSNKISTDSVVAAIATTRSAKSYRQEADTCLSQCSDECDSEENDDGDEDDGLKKRQNGNDLPHLTRNSKNTGASSTKNLRTGSSVRGKAAQRSSSVLQYRRRASMGHPNLASTANNTQVTGSQQWAIGSESDSVNNSNSPGSRYDTRRSATISAGTFASMTGQHQSRRRV